VSSDFSLRQDSASKKKQKKKESKKTLKHNLTQEVYAGKISKSTNLDAEALLKKDSEDATSLSRKAKKKSASTYC